MLALLLEDRKVMHLSKMHKDGRETTGGLVSVGYESFISLLPLERPLGLPTLTIHLSCQLVIYMTLPLVEGDAPFAAMYSLTSSTQGTFGIQNIR